MLLFKNLSVLTVMLVTLVILGKSLDTFKQWFQSIWVRKRFYKYLMFKEECLNEFSKNCFTILYTANTRNQLPVKEGLYIAWEMPSLNKQVQIIFDVTL